MTVLLALLLVILGLLLWIVAGLLPIAIVRKAEDGVDLDLATTWMGWIRLSRREVTNVHDARFVQDPNARPQSQVQIKRNAHWERLAVGFPPEAASQSQLAEIIRRYLKFDGPPALSMPMRSRLSLMIGFAVFFPMGTVSLFTGVLLLSGAL